MLDEMDAPQLKEWQALGVIEEEEYQRRKLASGAESTLQNYKRRGR